MRFLRKRSQFRSSRLFFFVHCMLRSSARLLSTTRSSQRLATTLRRLELESTRFSPAPILTQQSSSRLYSTMSLPSTMQACQIQEQGDLDVIKVHEVDVPKPGQGQVLIVLFVGASVY